MADEPTTIFDLVGAEFFDALVARFYEGVAADPVLRPLYPEEELEPAQARLTGFLIQYFGGPDDYSQARGHPRLRMRHNPYAIGPDERDRWLAHMEVALAERECHPLVRDFIWQYFTQAANSMMNQGLSQWSAPSS